MKVSKFILILCMGHLLFLSAPPVFSQTETLDIIQYTPPTGWTKKATEGLVVYSDINKTTGAFCILTIHASKPSAGSAQKDFANEWNELVVKPFKAETNPTPEIQTTPEGWRAAVGGAQIQIQDGVNAASILTVFSGFGKSVSILFILNQESYTAQADAFVAGVKLDKTRAVAKTTPDVRTDPGPTSQRDPFPDKPGYQPQKPLAGTLKESITMADLAGTWNSGGASVTTYVDPSSGNYSGTDTTFYGESYNIKADGTFNHNFAGRTGNHTVREVSNGVITLSGGFVIVKFTGGERRSTYKYQFISFMTMPNGGAVLTLVHIGDNDKGLTPEQLYYSCGHSQGFISCVSGDVWTLRTGK
jgi:hypothetical protein